MMTFVYAINIFYAYEKVSAAVYEESSVISAKIFDDSDYGVSGVKANIDARLGNGFFNSGIISGGKNGLDYSDTDFSNREIAVISIKYRIKLPFLIPTINELSFEVKCVVHTWVGYINGLNGYDGINDYVYMTKNGSVYHRNRECSHIRLNIVRVEGKDIKSLRNSNGGKYKQCEYCHPKLADNNLYITDDGDRFHNTLTCSGLKRTVIRVKLTDIEGIKPCSRCGF